MKLIKMLVLLSTLIIADDIQDCIDNPNTEYDTNTGQCVPTLYGFDTIDDLLDECSQDETTCLPRG